MEGKNCPFLDRECMEHDCKLWTQVQVAEVSPFGVAAKKTINVCAFSAIAMLVGSPKPQQMPLPDLTIRKG